MSDSSSHSRQLRVAIDATPLLGNPTGIGTFCREAISALSDLGDLSLETFAVTWRQQHAITSLVPEGVASGRRRRMPARPLHAMWKRMETPPIEWFVGSVDVVHGTNFVVPPTRGSASVMTVHDLTPIRYPEMCTKASLSYPTLIGRALRRGAWVHAVSEFVAGEVVDAFDVDPWRVRAIRHGVPRLPEVELGAAGRLSRPTCRRALSVRAGRRHDRTAEGPAQPGARLRRNWRRATLLLPSSWPVHGDGGRPLLTMRSRPRQREPGGPHWLGGRAHARCPPQRGSSAGLSVDLRGFRVPSPPGDGRRYSSRCHSGRGAS